MGKRDKKKEIQDAIDNGAKSMGVIFRTPEGKKGKIQLVIEKFGIPQSGGSYLKFYGIGQKWKGIPAQHNNDVVHLGKMIIYFVPRFLIGGSWIISGYFLFLFLIWPRKFWYLTSRLLQMVAKRSVKKVNIKESIYNEAETELKRAAEVAIKKEIGEEGWNKLGKKPKKGDKYNRYRAFKDLIDFFALIIYTDCVYRYRFQDLMKEWRNLPDRAMGSKFQELLKMAGDRELQSQGLKNKYKWIGRILMIVLARDRKLNRLAGHTMAELDTKKCEMDYEDRYFAYLMATYCYDGLTPEEMFTQWHIMEHNQGNYYIEVCKEEK